MALFVLLYADLLYAYEATVFTTNLARRAAKDYRRKRPSIIKNNTLFQVQVLIMSARIRSCLLHTIFLY